MNRIDVAAWTGIWPFTMTRETSLPDLVTSLQAVGIDGAVVSPLNAVLGPDPMPANRDLLDACRSAGDAFLLRVAPILDPTLPGWERDLEGLASDPLVAAIRLVPVYHRFAIDGPEAEEIVRAATAHGLPVCVQVRIIDERAHHPLMLVPAVPTAAIGRLARIVPEARFLVSGTFQSELSALADVSNVSIELSSVESADTLANALAVLGPERLLLGTHAPVYTPAPGVAKVDETDDPAIFRQIASDNASALFELP